MPRIARSEVVVPSQLSAGELELLIDSLYAVHREVFAGVEREAFARYVVRSKAERTSILVHRSEEGAIVGYFALHVFERELNGQPAAVFRAEAGTARAYRGGNANTRFGLQFGLAYRLANPGKRLYYLGSLVHPSSYSLFAKYFQVVYPSRGTATPPEMLSFMDQLATGFGLERVEPSRPLLRKVGWQTRDSEAERAYWRQCDKPAARFFVEQNPGYGEGHGLLTLVPVTLLALLGMMRRAVAQRLRRWADGVRAWLPSVPEIRRRLDAIQLFSGLPASTLHAIASSATVEVRPGGQLLFREGDAGDDLYVLSSGAAYVLMSRGGEETIVDELSSGSLVGEMATLAGERRTASVRTATASVFVKVPRAALLKAMEAAPELAGGLWRVFCERRFDGVVRALPRFSHLGREERMAWFRAGTSRRLAAEREAVLEPGGYLFLATGQVQLEQGGTLISARAPALVELKGAVKVLPQVEARAVHVPAPC